MEKIFDAFQAAYRETLTSAMGATSLPQALLDRYEVESCLAQHEDKEIYLVRRREDSTQGLLRITRAQAPEQAKAEAALLDRIHHPDLPKALFYGEEAGTTYLVRTYFPGNTLEQRLRKQGSFKAREAVPIIRALCSQLTALHTLIPPVIHRDIKPTNIILSPQGSIHLVDFGIARVLRPEGEADTVALGTKRYAPPEQFGFSQTDPRSDLYALGTVMLRMVTDSADRRALDQVRDAGLRRILSTCLAFDPSARYPSAQALSRALGHWQRRTAKKLVMGAAGALVLTAMLWGVYALGFRLGVQQGEANMLAPQPPQTGSAILTDEALYAPLTFGEQNLLLAVQNEQNLSFNAQVLRLHALRTTDLYIAGQSITHSSVLLTTMKTYNTQMQPVALAVDNQMTQRGTIASLEDLRMLTALHRLTLYSQRIRDLTPLTGLPLTELRLADNQIISLLPLKDMATLEVLDLSLNPVSDLRPLARLHRLRVLDISYTRVTDLTPLLALNPQQPITLYCQGIDDTVLAPLADSTGFIVVK